MTDNSSGSMASAGSTSRHEDVLQILLADYQALRDDERSTIAAQGLTISVATVLLGGMVAFAGQSCALDASHHNCTNIPVLFLASAPAVPFAALAYLMLQGIISVVRSYYVRAVELEIQAWVPEHFTTLGQLGPAFTWE